MALCIESGGICFTNKFCSPLCLQDLSQKMADLDKEIQRHKDLSLVRDTAIKGLHDEVKAKYREVWRQLNMMRSRPNTERYGVSLIFTLPVNSTTMHDEVKAKYREVWCQFNIYTSSEFYYNA